MSKQEVIKTLSALVAKSSEALSILSGNDGLVNSDQLLSSITVGGLDSLYYDISALEDSLCTIIGDCRAL